MAPSTSSSNSEKNRQDGKHQAAGRKDSILDAAEALFLQKGLENTSMVDIASRSGITKVTLYRYFPDRHPIAFEIAIRMLRRIYVTAPGESQEPTLLNLKRYAMAMIENFDSLRDAYRYIGMFDHLYGDRYPSDALAAWYKDQMIRMGLGEHFFQDTDANFSQRKTMIMLFNTIMSFLEKMAARGELMSAEQGIALEEELLLFKFMIGVYFDHLIESTNPSGTSIAGK